MSAKITPKNLSYNTTLPPFLARLQSNNNDRNEFQHARPKKARTAEDEAEDEPVYFDEGSGETLTRREWEEKEKKEEEEVAEGDGAGVVEEGKGEKEGGIKEQTAVIGASKKRKVGKVVGGDEDEEAGDKMATGPATKTAKESKGEESKKVSVAKGKGKPAKKAKKIKLSFGDDD